MSTVITWFNGNEYIFKGGNPAKIVLFPFCEEVYSSIKGNNFLPKKQDELLWMRHDLECVRAFISLRMQSFLLRITKILIRLRGLIWVFVWRTCQKIRCLTLRTRCYLFHYENTPIQLYRKFRLQKNENFQIKNSDIFYISAQNIDCGYLLEPPRQGGSNEYPQSMFLSKNKKNNVYPCKPQFYYIKVGYKGVKII